MSSLEKYKKKRKFSQTPEPEGKVGRGKLVRGGLERDRQAALRFVVQKHNASRLHYDFRLEMQGVLKSWAVPKGPSMNPSDKRLALMVEDHPLSYMTFEGNIPEGNYGAGNVIVWDIGTYRPAEEIEGAAKYIGDGAKYVEDAEKYFEGAERYFVSGLKKGHIDFFLKGKKLKGLFSLVRIKRSTQNKGNEWLLIKKRDEFAVLRDITKSADSVLTGKPLPEAVGEEQKKAKTGRADAKRGSRNIRGRRDINNSRTPGRDPRGFEKQSPKLTHLDKIFWPKEKYTKGDLIKYYQEIAPIILPYLKDRPESLNRHPNGINGKNFFQKDFTAKLPPYVETVKIHLESEQRTITSVVCQNIQTLFYLANLGCIEMNPGNARVQDLDKPDYAVIDLDPQGVPFARVVETAQAIHKILDRAGIESYCKTSGKTGLHIFVPLGAKYTQEQSRQFAETVAKLTNKNYPEFTSVVRNPKKRQKKVYADFLQNSHGQTIASAYCVRPWPKATVSTPLLWKEVKTGLDPSSFTMKNIMKRVDKIGDVWGGVLGAGIDLDQSLAKFSKLLGEQE